jgi:hypothetical protein
MHHLGCVRNHLPALVGQERLTSTLSVRFPLFFGKFLEPTRASTSRGGSAHEGSLLGPQCPYERFSKFVTHSYHLWFAFDENASTLPYLARVNNSFSADLRIGSSNITTMNIDFKGKRGICLSVLLYLVSNIPLLVFLVFTRFFLLLKF